MENKTKMTIGLLAGAAVFALAGMFTVPLADDGISYGWSFLFVIMFMVIIGPALIVSNVVK
jgi:hypothetical protein